MVTADGVANLLRQLDDRYGLPMHQLVKRDFSQLVSGASRSSAAQKQQAQGTTPK